MDWAEDKALKAVRESGVVGGGGEVNVLAQYLSEELRQARAEALEEAALWLFENDIALGTGAPTYFRYLAKQSRLGKLK